MPSALVGQGRLTVQNAEQSLLGPVLSPQDMMRPRAPGRCRCAENCTWGREVQCKEDWGSALTYAPSSGFSITELQRKQAMLNASKQQVTGKPKGRRTAAPPPQLPSPCPAHIPFSDPQSQAS